MPPLLDVADKVTEELSADPDDFLGRLAADQHRATQQAFLPRDEPVAILHWQPEKRQEHVSGQRNGKLRDQVAVPAFGKRVDQRADQRPNPRLPFSRLAWP